MRAYFTNNTNSEVTATSWDETCQDAQISDNGLLTAGDVTADSQGTVTATYSSGGIIRSAQKDITIEDTGSGGSPTLSHIVINGPANVDENTSATYTCTAHYTDGSTAQVAADNWTVDCPQTSISLNGVLNAGEVSANTQCIVTGTYQSISNEFNISIIDTTTVATLTSITIEGPSSVDENSTANYVCRAYYSDGSSQIVTPDSYTIITGISLADHHL